MLLSSKIKSDITSVKLNYRRSFFFHKSCGQFASFGSSGGHSYHLRQYQNTEQPKYARIIIAFCYSFLHAILLDLRLTKASAA